MKNFYKIICLSATIAVLMFQTAASAKVDLTALKPSPKHQEESRWVVRLVEKTHYKKTELDDAFSTRHLTNGKPAWMMT